MASSSDLPFLTLQELSALIKARDVSSRQVTLLQLVRIRSASNLNSYIKVLPELALDLADKADAELTAGIDKGILHGVPIALKDIFDLAGVPTTAGIPMRSNAIAKANAAITNRLKDAGAVILGKLATTEGVFAIHQAPYGSPVNPWNAEYYPGASSSGSGVTTASGLSYACLSSDTGGSIRLPSAANGVTGLKPTWSRVTRHGTFELGATLDHVGVIARRRSGRDCRTDPLDPTSSSEPVPDYCEIVDTAGKTIGYDPSWLEDGVHSAITASVRTVMAVFSSLGYRLVEVKLPSVDHVIWDWFEVCAVQTAIVHRDTYPGEGYSEALCDLIEQGRSLSGVQLQERLIRREEFAGDLQAVFSAVDLVIIQHCLVWCQSSTKLPISTVK
ncbi:MAG: amidase [Mesorhizobium sp.]|nr:MAG: amidase [Mesorhizobium sp.]